MLNKIQTNYDTIEKEHEEESRIDMFANDYKLNVFYKKHKDYNANLTKELYMERIENRNLLYLLETNVTIIDLGQGSVPIIKKCTN